MPAVMEDFMRRQLLDRRHRLEHAVVQADHTVVLHRLLDEVDAALARMEAGTFGICEVCHESVELDRLVADPLVRFCLDHLSGQEKRALEKDLQLAAQVQRGLLPPCDLAVPGWQLCYHYEPAGVVSGDYCDIVDQGAAGLYFMVGDVSGKGVAASMLMAHLHAMFRSLIPVGLPLQRIVEHASQVFCESSLPTHYATLVCGRAMPDGRIETCNAGHPQPLIVRGGEVTPVEGSNLPVGIFCHEQFPVEELSLEPGESLLIYSDGVSEATDPQGSEYGVERLSAVIRAARRGGPQSLIAACRDDLAAFRTRREDDVTMFVLQRTA